MSNQAKTEKKFKFKMPHMLFLVLIIMMLCSVLTYIIPAGQFATDADGKILGDQFVLAAEQSPVNPWQAMLQILPGMKNGANVMALLLISAGFTGIVVSTKAFDECIDWALYRLKDKGVTVLFPLMYILFAFIGGFAGNDSFIAMLPIALMFAKKLRLDPICALLIILFSYHMGGMTGPGGAMFTQIQMGLVPYSGLGMRMALWPTFALLGLAICYPYARKVSRDPHKSAMGMGKWYDDLGTASDVELKEVKLNWRAVAVVFLFLAQPFISLYFNSTLGYGQASQVVVWIALSIIVGLIYGYDFDTIGKLYGKGCSSMGFICVVIGMSNAISLILTNGNILHTIVNTLTTPLMDINRGFAAIGMMVVITILDVFIPSGTAKIAVLVPIIMPMCDMLELPYQMGVQAFQFGDKLVNMIAPTLATTMAAITIADVPYQKWLKVAFPRIMIMMGWSAVVLFFLTSIGWT